MKLGGFVRWKDDYNGTEAIIKRDCIDCKCDLAVSALQALDEDMQFSCIICLAKRCMSEPAPAKSSMDELEKYLNATSRH